MHQQAREFVARYATTDTISVIEIGSRDVNGIVRDLFPAADWLGIDLAPGPGVDIVCDAAQWDTLRRVDLVVCCETLEHAAEWREIIRRSFIWLRPGGRAIYTAAGLGRLPHSAVDGCELREGEYYCNISLMELEAAMVVAGYQIVVSEFAGLHSDVRAAGVRPQ